MSTSDVEGGDESIHYSDLTDEVIIDDIKDDAVKTKGYFIYPSQLFCNVVAKANNNGALLHTGHGVIPVLRRLIVIN
jgi:type I restriction enzyme M protein